MIDYTQNEINYIQVKQKRVNWPETGRTEEPQNHQPERTHKTEGHLQAEEVQRKQLVFPQKPKKKTKVAVYQRRPCKRNPKTTKKKRLFRQETGLAQIERLFVLVGDSKSQANVDQTAADEEPRNCGSADRLD